MRSTRSLVAIGIAAACAGHFVFAWVPRLTAQAPTAAAVNWPLHNLDLAGSRFSPMTQIGRTNVKTLVPRWLFQHGVIDGVSNQTTPVVVDGRMYVTDSRGSVYALDAADGHLLWNYDVTSLLGGAAREGYVFRNRGVVYGNGVVYAAGGSFLFALDAATGKPLPGFGNNGQASVILDVLRERYPDVKTAISMGYWFTTAPQYYNGVLYIGSTRSESHIPGGHVLAVDAKTGKVLWVFNTVPQNEKDQGWDIDGPTWVRGQIKLRRIAAAPQIAPALGLVYVAVGNPYGDSKKRTGTNLFTDSILALTLRDGRLKWYYQQTHHDVWDYDSGGPPTLFDMKVSGRDVKAIAQASKNGYLYILDRETGQPVHAIKEMPIPEDDRPGEHGWPTQPIPFTAAGKPMEPVSPIVPLEISPAHLQSNRIVPNCSPPRPNVVMAPGTGGGANYSPMAYSPQTGLLYVNAIDAPFNMGPGRLPKGYFSAYDPTTGELKWRQIFEVYGQGCSVVTAGGVVFVGAGSNIAGCSYAFDAQTGETLWKFNTGAGVYAAPSVYMVNGEEFVAVASGGGDRGRRGGDLILGFALPR